MLLDMCTHVSTKSHDKHPLAPEYIQHVTIIVSRTTTWYEWGAVGQGQIARAQFTCTGHLVGILKGNRRVMCVPRSMVRLGQFHAAALVVMVHAYSCALG